MRRQLDNQLEKSEGGRTGIKYLRINYRNKWKCNYHVSVNISRKQFTVWRGDNLEIGEKVALKVQELMSISKSAFLEWYDNDREGWLEENGYQNADS